MLRRLPFRLRQPSSLLAIISLCAVTGWSACAQAADAFDADSPWMTGDWGGLRTQWLNEGIDVQMGYTGESASNLHGGYQKHDKVTRYADQFNLGANINLQKLMGWSDAAFGVSLTNRNGDNISEKTSDPRAAGMSSSQQIQGRGSVTRLSELWFSKGWFDDRLNVKAGRFSVSDDFAVEEEEEAEEEEEYHHMY